MCNKFHRNEQANVYNVDSSNTVLNQIADLSPPWCIPCLPCTTTSFLTDSSYLDFNTPFSLDEFLQVIDDTRPNSCPGPDGIDYRILRTYLYLYNINKVFFFFSLTSSTRIFFQRNGNNSVFFLFLKRIPPNFARSPWLNAP